MDLLYATSYKRDRMPAAYERLLLEALAGDRSHFVSPEELEASWRIFTPALHALEQASSPPETYAYGGRGPKAADELAKRYGMHKFGGGLTPYVMLAERADSAKALRGSVKLRA
jgi:glucose-6-phosphate 1-dehydrogenase